MCDNLGLTLISFGWVAMQLDINILCPHSLTIRLNTSHLSTKWAQCNEPLIVISLRFLQHSFYTTYRFLLLDFVEFFFVFLEGHQALVLQVTLLVRQHLYVLRQFLQWHEFITFRFHVLLIPKPWLQLPSKSLFLLCLNSAIDYTQHIFEQKERLWIWCVSKAWAVYIWKSGYNIYVNVNNRDTTFIKHYTNFLNTHTCILSFNCCSLFFAIFSSFFLSNWVLCKDSSISCMKGPIYNINNQ